MTMDIAVTNQSKVQAQIRAIIEQFKAVQNKSKWLKGEQSIEKSQ